MGYFAFVSYARVNVNPNDSGDPLLKFFEDIKFRIKQKPDILGDEEPLFLDRTNIETGRDWNNELSYAAATSRVALAIYSPAYFTRKYCGREFQVFLDRREMAGVPYPVSMVPVLWQPCTIPDAARPTQWADAGMPPTYERDGLEIISRLGRPGEYQQAVIAIGNRLLDAVGQPRGAQSLTELQNPDLKTHDYAFPKEPNAPGKGTVDSPSAALKMTRFVFLSGQGWDWKPYANEDSIGVLATELAAKLKVRYEEIPCNASLHTTLDKTEDAGIPTLLISDPSSVTDPVIKAEMEDYDKRLYDNCGLVVPWDTPSPSTDPRWKQIKLIFKRKTDALLQNHDWTSAISRDLFTSKALAIIEGIRMKRMNTLMSSGGDFAKAEDAAGQKAAEEQGINVDRTPQLDNVTVVGK